MLSPRKTLRLSPLPSSPLRQRSHLSPIGPQMSHLVTHAACCFFSSINLGPFPFQCCFGMFSTRFQSPVPPFTHPVARNKIQYRFPCHGPAIKRFSYPFIWLHYLPLYGSLNPSSKHPKSPDPRKKAMSYFSEIFLAITSDVYPRQIPSAQRFTYGGLATSCCFLFTLIPDGNRINQSFTL